MIIAATLGWQERFIGEVVCIWCSWFYRLSFITWTNHAYKEEI
jgi:hypothetical protein